MTFFCLFRFTDYLSLARSSKCPDTFCTSVRFITGFVTFFFFSLLSYISHRNSSTFESAYSTCPRTFLPLFFLFLLFFLFCRFFIFYLYFEVQFFGWCSMSYSFFTLASLFSRFIQPLLLLIPGPSPLSLSLFLSPSLLLFVLFHVCLSSSPLVAWIATFLRFSERLLLTLDRINHIQMSLQFKLIFGWKFNLRMLCMSQSFDVSFGDVAAASQLLTDRHPLISLISFFRSFSFFHHRPLTIFEKAKQKVIKLKNG